MYFQIGDIEFNELMGFSSLEINHGAKVAQMPRSNNKARLQQTGVELQGLSISATLHRGFIEPQDIIDRIKSYVEASEVINVIDGNGKFYGRFVILSLKESIETLATDGTKISVAISFDLLEFFEDDKESSESITARNQAAALEENKPFKVIRKPTPNTPLIESLQILSIGNGNSNDSIGLVNLAATNPTQSQSLLGTVKVKMEKAVESYTETITLINQKEDEFNAISADFKDDVQETLILATSLKNAAESQDLSGALNFSSSLANTLLNLKTSQRSLDVQAILRKKL